MNTTHTITHLASAANAAITAARMAPANWAQVDWRKAKDACQAVARALAAGGQLNSAKAWRAQARKIKQRLGR